MKIKSSIVGPILMALTFAALVYGGAIWGIDVMVKMKSWFARQARDAGVLKPAAPPVAKPAPAKPLAEQLSLCRKRGPGFHACMLDAGYAVNAAWTTAHRNDSRGTAAPGDLGATADVLGDPYRATVSPVYGVPYWVPRQ